MFAFLVKHGQTTSFPTPRFHWMNVRLCAVKIALAISVVECVCLLGLNFIAYCGNAQKNAHIESRAWWAVTGEPVYFTCKWHWTYVNWGFPNAIGSSDSKELMFKSFRMESGLSKLVRKSTRHRSSTFLDINLNDNNENLFQLLTHCLYCWLPIVKLKASK